jgi:hypothetical protein
MVVMADAQNTKLGKQKLLSTPVEQITKAFIEDMFASYHDRESNTFKYANFDCNAHIMLTPEEYPYVIGPTETSLGMLLFNRYVLEGSHVIQVTKYWNIPLSKKGTGKFERMIAELVVTDQITTTDQANVIDSRDRLAAWVCCFLGTAVSGSLLRPMENVNKRKEELFKQYATELNSNDPIQQVMRSNAIEADLMKLVRENLKTAGEVNDLFNSGVYDLDNNYKTINVMRGAVFNDITQRYDVVKNSMMDGIDRTGIPAFANSIVAGAYPSAVGTADAGYMSKKMMALLQSEELDPNPKSDCGTKATIPLTIDDITAPYVLERNIVDGSKIVTLTSKNIGSYMGKTVKLCSPACCTHDRICAKCAGPLFYQFGVTRIGLLCTQFTDRILNIKLKSKHNLSQSAGAMKVEKTMLSDTDKVYIKDGYLFNKEKMRIFIPRIKDESEGDVDLVGFEREPTYIACLGVVPAKFYDKNDREIATTLITIPSLLTFNLYAEPQEDSDYTIITYEPDSAVTKLAIRQNIVNVEYFINQIFLYSKVAQIPYSLLVQMLFNCLAMNKIDLESPSIIYEMLVRRTCRTEDFDTFAKVYGKDPSVDQLSYKKDNFRTLVQTSNFLSGLLFQDVSNSVKKGLCSTLNNRKQRETPLETIVKI